LKSVQFAKRGFGQRRCCTPINVWQILPKFSCYKNLGKDQRAIFLLYKSLVKSFGRRGGD
jgi:hypothetical protein